MGALNAPGALVLPSPYSRMRYLPAKKKEAPASAANSSHIRFSSLSARHQLRRCARACREYRPWIIGRPGEFPPCILHRALPRMAGARQGVPNRVLAPHLGARCMG